MSAENPKDYRYLQSHEWHKKEADGTIAIGITQHAADELTDITYVELPKVGTTVTKGQRWGIVESVKTASDLYAGVSGTVAAVNEELVKTPQLVNSDAFTKGWMIKIKPSNPAEFDQLLSAEDYEKTIAL
jgi:glycine cleavage system H protein